MNVYITVSLYERRVRIANRKEQGTIVENEIRLLISIQPHNIGMNE